MEKRKYKVGIVTLSDKGSRGEREDLRSEDSGITSGRSV